MENAYLAILFGTAAANAAFFTEVVKELNAVSANRVKRAESAANTTALAFICDLPQADLAKRMTPLWRPEDRLWVIPLTNPILIDKAIMEWLRKHSK